jgi:hypothetical protein
MQSRKAVGPDLVKLEIASQASDRFAYQNRFVPLIIRDADGRPVISVVQHKQSNTRLSYPNRLRLAHHCIHCCYFASVKYEWEFAHICERSLAYDPQDTKET